MQAVYKGTDKGKWGFGKGQIWNEKVAKVARMEERTRGRRARARKEEQGKRKVARENPERVGRVARQDTLQLGAGMEEIRICTPQMKTTARTLKSRPRVLLEESENEQWQEVISRGNKQRVKRANQALLLSVENSHSSNPKKVVEVKDKWVNVRVTVDSGAAGHVMPETMFPRVKLERRTSPKKFVAANGEQIKDLGEKNPIQDKRGNPEVHNIHKCKCCQTHHFNAKVVRAGNTCSAG